MTDDYPSDGGGEQNTTERLTECRACDEFCTGAYCSDECRNYYETERGQPL